MTKPDIEFRRWGKRMDRRSLLKATGLGVVGGAGLATAAILGVPRIRGGEADQGLDSELEATAREYLVPFQEITAVCLRPDSTLAASLQNTLSLDKFQKAIVTANFRVNGTPLQSDVTNVDPQDVNHLWTQIDVLIDPTFTDDGKQGLGIDLMSSIDYEQAEDASRTMKKSMSFSANPEQKLIPSMEQVLRVGGAGTTFHSPFSGDQLKDFVSSVISQPDDNSVSIVRRDGATVGGVVIADWANNGIPCELVINSTGSVSLSFSQNVIPQ